MSSTCPQRMLHFPFSTQGLFFISSGFRKGSSGMPSSIHFTNLQGEHGGHTAFLGHPTPSVRGFASHRSGRAQPISALLCAHSLGYRLGGHLPLVGQLVLQALHLLLPLGQVPLIHGAGAQWGLEDRVSPCSPSHPWQTHSPAST